MSTPPGRGRFASPATGPAGRIERAHSVAISAHKWFFQPKDCALVLFADAGAERLVSFGGAYLAVPNVGVQGSRGAQAIPLLGTLLAWGRTGLAERLERCMATADQLARRLDADPRATLKQPPVTGVVNWRPATGEIEPVLDRLGATASRTAIEGAVWARHAAANPNADIEAIWSRIDRALRPD